MSPDSLVLTVIAHRERNLNLNLALDQCLIGHNGCSRFYELPLRSRFCHTTELLLSYKLRANVAAT